MHLYIRDTKEKEVDKVDIGSVSERGNSGGSGGEGVVKGNGGGRRERPKTETTKSATRRGEIEIRDMERRERREDNPLFFVELTRTPAISRPIKSRRGLRLLSLFYLFSLYFTLIG